MANTAGREAIEHNMLGRHGDGESVETTQVEFPKVRELNLGEGAEAREGVVTAAAESSSTRATTAITAKQPVRERALESASTIVCKKDRACVYCLYSDERNVRTARHLPKKIREA